ncbi:hypothetical protein IKP85_04050 [bacterium]|nr:hypothetical protein [bacterium]
MEVQQITPKIEQQNKPHIELAKKASQPDISNPSFSGATDMLYAVPAVFLRFLDTNQAWGANLVDLGSMVIPRTAYDMSHRGFATGMETARRESTGTFNHAMVGVYGTFLGAALAYGINRAYEMKAHKIFANNDTLNILGDSWYKALHSGTTDPLKDHLNNIVSNIRVYNPTSEKAVESMVSIGEGTRNLVVDRLYNLIKNSDPKKETIGEKDVDYIKRLITASTGGEKSVTLNGFYKGHPATADNTLSTLIENIHNVTKAFNKEKVVKSFTDAVDFDSVKIMKSLKRLNISRSIAGLGFAALFGMSVQPVNMYITKKKTGCDGFPGIPGRKKDKSTSFKIFKSAMALLFGAGAISTIMIGDKKSAVKELNKAVPKIDQLKEFGNRFLAKIQFKGMMPTINQLKFVYGMTITSRFMCARDKDELRESMVKDTLGFLNLLILGALVTKGATRLMNKNLINLPKNAGKGFMNWMRNSSVKSRDEVLLETLGKHGIEVTKDGNALSYAKLLDKIKELPKDVKSDLWKKLLTLDFAQLVGYAYSGIFLGYYLPKINATMSAANEEKRIARVAKEEGKTVEQVKAEMAEELKKMEAQARGEKYEPQKPTEDSPATTQLNNSVLKNQINSFTSKYMS